PGIGSGRGSGRGTGGCGSGIGGCGIGSGDGTGGAGVGPGTGGAGTEASSHDGTWSTVRSSGSVVGAGAVSAGGCSPSACRCAASVARKSSASGPSRMLARRRAIEHLLGEIAVHLRG